MRRRRPDLGDEFLRASALISKARDKAGPASLPVVGGILVKRERVLPDLVRGIMDIYQLDEVHLEPLSDFAEWWENFLPTGLEGYESLMEAAYVVDYALTGGSVTKLFLGSALGRRSISLQGMAAVAYCDWVRRKRPNPEKVKQSVRNLKAIRQPPADDDKAARKTLKFAEEIFQAGALAHGITPSSVSPPAS